MTPMFRDRIDHPMAWRGGEFSKEDISFDLSPLHVAALEDVLFRIRKAGLPLGEIRAEHCRHPALDHDLERVFDEIQEGRGIVIVRGLPVGGQTQRAEKYGARSQHPDRSASYYIRDEYPADHPDRLAKKVWVFDNRWPADLPGFRERTLAYFSVMHALMTKLLPLQAVALDLPANYLVDHEGFQPMNCTLRLLNYPPRIAENAGLQRGYGLTSGETLFLETASRRPFSASIFPQLAINSCGPPNDRVAAA